MLDLSKLPNKAPEYDLEELLEIGCHFGHQKSKWHPKMAEYIYMEKDGVHIFDLAKTAAQLQIAYNYAYQLGAQGKTLVVVGTKKQARDVVEEVAEKEGAMHIASRWLGGLLTNWEQVNRSIKKMKDQEKGLADGSFKGYTKYEITQIEKEVARAQRFFGGIRELRGKPDCLFIIDPTREKNAINEARAEGVTIMALADSNADPSDIDIVIPSNDDAKKCLEFMIAEVVGAYAKGKKAV